VIGQLVTIADLGVSNVGSLVNMCAKLGYPAQVTRDPVRVVDAERVLLPGVGAFDYAMERLDSDGLADAIRACAAAGSMLLGICLGMQLLFEGSDEGRRSGLGVIPGWVHRLPVETACGRVRIPHMGWNTIAPERESALLSHTDARSRFYFVHSYAAVPADPADVVARTSHGDPFVSVVERGSVRGVQFHPEKSHRHGAALLRSVFEF
jgi:glutamine amidotransferase